MQSGQYKFGDGQLRWDDDEGVERSFVEFVDSVNSYEPVIEFIEKYYTFL